MIVHQTSATPGIAACGQVDNSTGSFITCPDCIKVLRLAHEARK